MIQVSVCSSLSPSMPSNLHEGFWKMLFFSDRKQKMSSAALTSITRSALGAMVEQEARRVGSRTLAYERVAQMVGASSSWVRKFLANTGEVSEPRITLFSNIRAAYNNICERIEADNRADEARLQALRGSLNAVGEGFSAESDTESPASVGEG
jgi:hypothetical protein